jgi:hypothetical protein
MFDSIDDQKDHCSIIKNIEDKITALTKAQHCISSLETISPDCIESKYKGMLSELILDLYDHKNQPFI